MSVHYGLTVGGTLICRAPDTLKGVGDFWLLGGGTLEVAHSTGINGAVQNTGTQTFSKAANYIFNGSVPQVTGSLLPDTLMAPDTLTINNSSGVTLSHSVLSTGLLALTNGILRTAAYTISLPGAAGAVTGAGAANYVNGTLIKTITGLAAVNYEVGDTDYCPMKLTLSAAGTGGSLGVRSVYGLHPNVSTSGITPTTITTHYWTLGNYSAAGPATVIPKATYNSADIVGGSNTLFVTQQHAGTAWLGAPLASTNTSTPYTSAPNTGIALASLAGDYIFGKAGFDSAALAVASATQPLAYMSLFPNPANGVFTLTMHTPQREPMLITITNVAGSIICTREAVTNEQANIDLKAAPGIYFVRSTSAHGSCSGQVVLR
jgi:hypothetical protein